MSEQRRKSRPFRKTSRRPFNPALSPLMQALIERAVGKPAATPDAQLARAEVVPGSLPRERFSEF